jgi:hypothetical protein
MEIILECREEKEKGAVKHSTPSPDAVLLFGSR